MIDFLNNIVNFLKPYSAWIVGGLIGSVIDRLRHEMSITQFIKSTIVGIFVSVCTGIGCQEYFGIENQNILFMICGISGVYSKLILVELELILKMASTFVKQKMGLK